MSDCPTREQLQQLLNDQLAATTDQEVSGHVERCSACQRRLEELTASPPRPVAATPSSTALADDLLERLLTAPASLALRTPAQPRTLPTQAGPYQLLRELGHGGMGVVYLARHAALQRLVAVKMLTTGGAAGSVARFRAEAETLARLQHPNIVQIHDVGEEHGQPFLVMEYVAGGTLDERLRGKPLSPRLAVELLLPLADAVEAAHGAGIIHRDLKPANVLLQRKSELRNPNSDKEDRGVVSDLELRMSDLEPKVTDFGLAKRLDEPSRLTRTGLVVGTPSYMAPEQAEGKPLVSPAVDVWALGAILYECLTGRPPFVADSATQILLQVIGEDPVPPSRLQPGVPRDLETICLKCLEKDPARRFASARDLADDLRRFQRGEPIHAQPARAWNVAWKWARRKPTAAALVGLLLLLALVGMPSMTALWLQANQQRQEKEEERDRANAARLDLEHAVYASRIVQAQRAYQENDIAVLDAMLERARPAPERPDLRGWEWHYLSRLREGSLHPGMRHSLEGWNFVHGLAVFPDGGRVATVAGYPAGYTDRRGRTYVTTPGELRVWDLKTGTCLLQRATSVTATAVAVGPDGRTLAIGDAKGNVQLLDLASGQPLPGPPALTNGINSLAFAPAGRALACFSDSALVVWDCNERRARFTVPGSWYLARGAFRSDAGLLVVVARQMNGARAWEVDSGKEVALPLPSERANTLAMSPDRPLLALARGKDVEIRDADGARLLQRLSGHIKTVEALAFGPEGRLASGSDDGSIRIWDAASGRELMVLRGHKVAVTSLGFAAQGRQLVSADKEQVVKVWDVTHSPEGLRLQVGRDGRQGEWIGQLAFAADGRSLLVERDAGVAGQPHRLQRWDLAQARLVVEQPLRLGSRPANRPTWDHMFSADGRRLASADPDEPGTLRVFATADGALIQTIQTGAAGISPVALSADGTALAYRTRPSAPGMGRAEVCIVAVPTGQFQARIEMPAGRWVDSACFSSDGRLLAGAEMRAATEDDPGTAPGSSLVVWETATGREHQRLAVEPWVSRSCMVFSPDGDRLAAADRTGIVRVWDLAKSGPAFPSLRTATSVTGLAFSPDGRRLAAAGLDDRVRLYDAVAGHELLELRALGMPGSGHYGYTARVAFSPDGSHIATNDWSGTVSIWSAELTGR